MKKPLMIIFSAMMIVAMLLGACQQKDAAPTDEGAEPSGETAVVEESGTVKMTFVNTPRNKTLILDELNGRVEQPEQFNMYVPGTSMGRGFHELCTDHLWEIDTTTGDQYGSLAAEMPEPLNDDFTSHKIVLRQGIKWDDGEDFNADDIIFTIDMLMATPDLPYSGWLSAFIESVEKVDDYTVIINTLKPAPRFAKELGVTIWGVGFYPVPEHVWSGVDPVTFKNYPPTCIGQYSYKDHDPNGNWLLWELREDWENSSVGQVVGTAGPEFVMWNFVGSEEKRILAMVNNDVDILQDITPESMQVLINRSDTARAWIDGFPYADFDDPCERGISFNNSEFPYSDKRVRWALALSTDIKNVSLATFAGMLRVSPLGVPPVTAVQEVYHKPMVDRLLAFELDDGYKPFDPNFAEEMAQIFIEQGYGDDLPATAEELVSLFGVGWWKYDLEQAAKLLEEVGMTKGNDGKWYLPDGTQWKIAINAPADFEVQSGRLAYAVADSWSKAGIETTVNAMTGTTFWNAQGTGEFDAGSYWPGCAIGADIYPNLKGWHNKFLAPTGEFPSGNVNRLDSEKVSGILDQLEVISTNDPRNVELSTDLLMAMAEEMHWIPMFGTSKFVPVNEYYWTNYPTADNYYEGPWWWWSNFKYIVAHIEPTNQ